MSVDEELTSCTGAAAAAQGAVARHEIGTAFAKARLLGAGEPRRWRLDISAGACNDAQQVRLLRQARPVAANTHM